MENNLTLLVCNYNTPDLILNLLKSVQLTCSNLPKVLVVDTSTNPTKEKDFLEELGIPAIYSGGSCHGDAVNLGFEKIQTDHVLLVDSDVICLNDFQIPYEKFKDLDFTLFGKVSGDRGGKLLYPRVDPWHCFINLKHLKDHDIKFIDWERTMNSKQSGGRIYDVGSTMFEDVMNAGLMIGNLAMGDKWFKHYEGMSWRVQKFNPQDADTDVDLGGTHNNVGLYDHGLKIARMYKEENEDLQHVDLKGWFCEN